MGIFLTLTAGAATITAQPSILVTASRFPVESDEASASATVIDRDRLDSLGESQAIDALRLVPGVSVAVTGARGSQAQIRVRGAEANHTLLFVDGIDFSDITAGNEARFETLTTDGIERIEIIRGPQSALWGSEALGGVIALQSRDPLSGTSLEMLGEAGSHGSLRGSASAVLSGSDHGISLTASHAASDGIDTLGGGTGDRDGFDTLTLGLLAIARPGRDGEFGLAVRRIESSVDIDGVDPVFFTRADTLGRSRYETTAVRAWARLGTGPTSPTAVQLDGQVLRSENRNFDGRASLNRAAGERFKLSGQIETRLGVGRTRHQLVASIEREDEKFIARDQQFFGATDQTQTRSQTGFVGAWRAQWTDGFSTDLSARRDQFNRFDNAASLRVVARLAVTDRLSVSGSYGEGIAQPSFYELFGFFPGSFIGNPLVRAEKSSGVEVAVNWASERFQFSITAFQNDLEDEIVATFDPLTFLSSTANATGISNRRGIEIAVSMQPVEGLRVDAGYSFVDASDQRIDGGAELREVRRPRHSATIAFDYRAGGFTLGGSAALVGNRRDTDFDLFPAQSVTLESYVLVSSRIAYEVSENIEIFGRVNNLLNEEYQDVVGYNTPGLAAYAGLRLRLGS
jgi:vitamin B12 transporter